MEMALSLALLISFVIGSSNGENDFFASSNIYVPGAVEQYTDRTNIECCSICSEMANCVASNWNSLTRECEILTADPAGRVPNYKQNWMFYTSACPSLGNPPNGNVVTTGFVRGSMATYTCDPLYYLPGLATRICGLFAAWSSPVPVCQPLCPFLETSNGNVVTTGFVEGSTATYTCDNSYYVVGVATRTCGSSGVWSGQIPYCQPECPFLETSNGNVVTTGFVEGSTATYTCDNSYYVVGVATRTCGSSGVWSGQIPYCQPECPFLETSNGNVVTTGFVEGSTATYTCDNSYYVVGVATRTCGSSGVWSGQIPYCQPECPFLETSNGNVVTTGFVEGSTATYTCDNSYYVVGVATRTCGSSGVWSGQIPYCQPECPFLETSNGNVVTTGFVEGSTATYTCDNSYYVVGVATRTCGSSGVWSGQIPYCQPECPFLETSNGNVVTTGFLEGSTATYTCDNSYYVVGVATRTCGSSGVWSGQIPYCQLECGSFLSSYANTEIVEGPSCLRDGCDLYAKCKLGFKQPPGLTDPIRFVCNALGYWTSSSGIDCSYELMFRGTAKNDIDILLAYDPGTGSTTNPNCIDVHNSTCNQHYRNVKMNVWNSLGITNVLYEMYEGGSTIMSVVFDAQGRTSTKWMGDFSARTIKSAVPWTHLVQSQLYTSSLLWNRYIGQAFCIRDVNFGESQCEKRYYTVVLVYATSNCVDPTISSWPIFLYSDTIGSYYYPNQESSFKEASSMAVWVQTTN